MLNALSAHWQFNTGEELSRSLAELVSCFEFIEPGVQAGTISLTYDPYIELRGLLSDGGTPIQSCLAEAAQKERLRWYHYTKNLAHRSEDDCIQVELSGGGEVITGDAVEEVLNVDIFVGFGGSPACEADEVQIRNIESGEHVTRASASRLGRLSGLLPRYERNDKHRSYAYTRTGGERVAPMTVSDADAQVALLAAIRYENSLFGIFGAKLLKFVLTGGLGGGVYHAYEVEEREVPNDVLVDLLGRIQRNVRL